MEARTSRLRYAEAPLQITDDIMLCDTHYIPARRIERAVPRGIEMRAPIMRASVDLDDETQVGARKVDDVIADDELTTECEPGFGPGERTPEPRAMACKPSIKDGWQGFGTVQTRFP